MGGEKLEENKLFHEMLARAQGHTVIAGVDEAGRGPLAGPVVAACCSLSDSLRIEGIDDSKKMTPRKRLEIYDNLINHPDVRYSIGIVEAEEIDRLNIYQATIKAMTTAIDTMLIKPEYVIVDGMNLDHPDIKTERLVKGDALSIYVGAASIIAKVTRDRIMEGHHKTWPMYKFDKHKGYGTSEHLESLGKYGPCAIHRKSFEPMKTYFAELKSCCIV